MPHHETRTIKGKIGHIFHHRFVVETEDGAVLADVTPTGLAHIALRRGDRVELFGEMKPSELKVQRFTRDGETIEITHKPKHGKDHDHAPADPKLAMKAAKAAGLDPLGEPRRKPKHFEVLGRRGDELTELHVELDGHIRKSKPADRHDPKWADALNAA